MPCPGSYALGQERMMTSFFNKNDVIMRSCLGTRLVIYYLASFPNCYPDYILQPAVEQDKIKSFYLPEACQSVLVDGTLLGHK